MFAGFLIDLFYIEDKLTRYRKSKNLHTQSKQRLSDKALSIKSTLILLFKANEDLNFKS